MNLYLKLFLPFFIAGVVAVFITSFLIGYPEIVISFGIPFAFFLAIILTFIIGTLHITLVKRMPYGNSKEALNVSHIRNIELQIPYDNLFDLCLDSIKSIKNWKIKKEDRSQGNIYTRTGINWKTMGENIIIKIIKIDSNRTQVEFSSRPTIPTTLIDYGKNLENIEIINNFLKENTNRLLAN